MTKKLTKEERIDLGLPLRSALASVLQNEFHKPKVQPPKKGKGAKYKRKCKYPKKDVE